MWNHGPWGCSLVVLDGLLSLSITASARKPVVVDGQTYPRTDARAYEVPGNVVWKASIQGYKNLDCGKWPTKENAMLAAENRIKLLLGDKIVLPLR